MKRLCALVGLLFFSSASGLSAQKTVFGSVELCLHRSDKRALLDKYGALTFDDSAHKLEFRAYADDHNEVSYADDHIDVPYDEVEKVVSEVTTHMLGGGVSRVVSFLEPPYGLLAGGALASVHVNSNWLYLRYRSGENIISILLESPQKTSAQIASKANAVFGSRMSVTGFSEKAADVKLSDLKELKSTQAVKVDKKNHPLPETKPEKVTVVVVCPTLAGHREGSGVQFKMFANGEVIAVNRLGTYSFAYLDPGKYRLVSQHRNASGFEMDLEAGQQYFFLQNTFQDGFTATKTVLSRNSPELVNYLLDGSYFSDWKAKAK